jgi:hypothetical protein
MNLQSTYTIQERVTRAGRIVPAIVVDASIKDDVLNYTWHMAGGKGVGKYPTALINGKPMMLHRFVWSLKRGAPPKMIDHIDRNPLNATIDNLREATWELNNMNRVFRCGKSMPGTRKNYNKWQSRLIVGGKRVHLGMFSTEAEAHECYMAEKAKLLAA